MILTRMGSLAGWVLLLGGAGVFAQPVPTVTLVANTGAGGFALEGVVQAVHQTTVSAQANGRVLTLRVKAGDPVKAGQLLATIDDRETAVASQRSQAQMLQAQAEHRNMQAQYDRTRELQQKGFVSKAALDTATSQLQAAQAATEQAKASVQQSGISAGYTRLTAPYAGWVLQTHLQEGDLAQPGTPVVTVYAPQPLRAVLQMPGSRAADARAATQTTLEVQGPGGVGTAVKALGRQIVPSADPVSQTSEWRWDLSPQDAANLIPGQPVRAIFAGATQSTASSVWVPQQAIVRRGELTAVYVAQGQGFVLRAIRTGSTKTADAQEVMAGLRPGDVVALDPLQAAKQR
jgi:RND family efflux transporter MFP subunit